MNPPKILIAIPMLNTVNVNFLTSLLCLQGNGNTQFAVEIGSLVYMARNKLAARAVEGKYDYILWLDSDMVLPPDVGKRLVQQAMLGRDYVSGLYFKRGLPTHPIIYQDIVWERGEDGIIKHGAEPFMEYPKDQVFQIAGSGLGCCLMKVDIIKQVVSSFMQPPFDPLPALGEDFSFCWRLNKLGIKMWCDSRVKCGHVGEMIFDEDVFIGQQAMNKEE